MIISRTPLRISFFGGGTDYPEYIKDNPGASLVTTINKYIYITARWLPPFFDFKYRIVYSKVEDVDEIKYIQHPSVRETLKYLNIEDGIEVQPASDLPARTGLGSSSCFTVGLLNALYSLKNINVPRKKIASDAIYIEQKMCDDIVGCQDQISTCLGGLNHLKFNNKEWEAEKVSVSQQRLKELNNNLLLYFTGFSRNASEIAKHQVENIPKTEKYLKVMYEMVQRGVDIIHNGTLKDFGYMLHDTWDIKRRLSDKISNTKIDCMYTKALSSGAIGGKLLGAGGGGFLLFYVEKQNQEKVRTALKGFLEIPFKFENTGTQILINNEEDNGK